MSDGEPVGLPANCRRAHSEAVKRSSGTPCFLDLLPDLSIDPETPGLSDMRVVWATPLAGSAADEIDGHVLFVDYSETLPAPAHGKHIDAAATMWSLHLEEEGRLASEGALISFQDATLYSKVSELITPEDLPDLSKAMTQYRRLAGPDGIAARQFAHLQESRIGMEAGAGLPMKPLAGAGGLPRGLAVQIPAEADVATFISYARNENVVVEWLPEIQPMFYVGYQVTQDRERTFQTAANLARWIVSPIGPDFDDDQIVHSVLGILKAAEYTGIRWYTDRERAAWYGNLMLEWYGPAHDAYRPAFLDISPEGTFLAGI
ncbi:MAG: hypothetical protein KC438_02255 [Thermomicrobiales bacterium]|nr:hypothetical protein [Thermomicrobiales bacterium]MCO5221553.1 hypothetical protein [Thermomicrobiales bacterium]